MKLHKTLLGTLVAAAFVAGAAPALAAPVWSNGDNTAGNTALNDIELINRENLYRASSACTDATCFPSDPNRDPTGYRRIVASSTLQQGDIFIGILQLREVRNADTGVTWNNDSTTPVIDEFTGYFVQEVKQVNQTYDGGNHSRNILGGLSVADPFGILNVAGADGIFGTTDDISTGLWVDQGTNGVNASVARLDGMVLTVAQSIASVTDGALWAYLGVGADSAIMGANGTVGAADLDGYAWSEFDLTAATFTGNFYVAYNIIETGAGFNLPTPIRQINDPAESLLGGSKAGDGIVNPYPTTVNNYFGLCTETAGNPNAANPITMDSAGFACDDIVGNGQLSANQSISPWTFASEDPLQVNAVPEPATIALVGLGLLGMGAGLRRRTN